MSLLVEIGGETLAIPESAVREVARLGELTPLPGSPPGVLGLSQLRGQVLAVLEPARGGPSPPPRYEDAVVLVEVHGVRAALRVDAVVGAGPAGEHRVLDPAALFAALQRRGAIGEAQLLAAHDGARTVEAGASGIAHTDAGGAQHRAPTTGRGAPDQPALTAADIEELHAFFLDEAGEHLDNADQALRRLERDPTDEAALASLLRDLHTLKGSAGSVGLHRFATAAHRIEDRLALLRGRPPTAAELSSVGSAFEQLRVEVSRGGAPVAAGADEATPSLPAAEEAPQIRVEVSRVDALMASVGELVVDRTRFSRQIVELVTSGRELASVEAWMADLSRGDAGHLPDARATLASALRRLARSTSSMLATSESLTRSTQALKDGLQGMRMMEAGKLFERLAHRGHELAQRSGREVEVRATGVATAIDKQVIERIAEPLLHLLRNAIAHGIEPPEQRLAKGKPRGGRVELSARQRGDQILIEVSDDGAGIDLQGVRRSLVRLGRCTEAAAAALSDAEVMAAIFQPGVSTREDVDDLAGRGVGLDAVKDAIARLGGVIGCVSTSGGGTRFLVRLPLTTAIARALLFKVCGQVYAVPAMQCVEIALAPSLPRRPTELDGLPLLFLDTLLDTAAPPSPDAAEPATEPTTDAAADPPLDARSDRRAAAEPGADRGDPVKRSTNAMPAVVIDHDGDRFVIACDRIIGEREIVIKGLGPLLSSLPLYAGATISGGGKVQLLLDLAELAARAGVVAGSSSPSSPSSSGPAGSGGGAARGPSKRVLVVDDSRVAREAAARIVERAGYLVDTAPGGAEAYELLGGGRHDLLVTDLEMPTVDGFALLELMKASPSLSRLPVLVMSSLGPDARARSLSIGAAGFLGKPLDAAELLAAVAAALDRPGPG